MSDLADNRGQYTQGLGLIMRTLGLSRSTLSLILNDQPERGGLIARGLVRVAQAAGMTPTYAVAPFPQTASARAFGTPGLQVM
ncbi:MAG: hypothetical protein K2X32_14530, partial [Phycisphaerales bacterium]|nr:hypothetical protein [Phycisphaerales bacterium]